MSALQGGTSSIVTVSPVIRGRSSTPEVSWPTPFCTTPESGASAKQYVLWWWGPIIILNMAKLSP